MRAALRESPFYRNMEVPACTQRVAIPIAEAFASVKGLGAASGVCSVLFTSPTAINLESQVIIERPASRIRQGDLVLYATSLRVRDLRIPNFCRIDTLDSDQGVGYQRVLNETRAKRLAEYLLDANKEHQAFLPTSIFLATDKILPFNEGSNSLMIDTDRIGSFNVVDGQHRIRGLTIAAEKDSAMDDFEVPVNIGVGLDAISQMCHFLIVNTTQKSVDGAIEQQIVARLTDMVDFEKTPVLPRWIQRQVDKGEDHTALAITQYLNSNGGSPWEGRIRMANTLDEAGSARVNQKSFVTSLKKYVLVPSNPISAYSVDKQQKILFNYWKSIMDLLVETDDDSSVIYKTNGIDLFHTVSPVIFLHLANKQDFKQETIRQLLTHGFENLPNEFLAMGHPQFWHRGEGASGLNQAAIRKYAQALAAAVNARTGAIEVEI
jgi:DGQHR domain-containing protein